MRNALLISLLSASASFAQQGVWTGYVGGWQNTPAPVAVHPLALTYQTPAYRQLNFIARNSYGGYAYAPYVPYQLQPDSDDQEAARQAALQQQEVAAQQREYDRQQALAAQQQMLAQQQELAAQQQQVAQQQQQALIQELARIADREAQLRQVEAEQKLLAAREAERQRAEAEAAKPREKGPDIHRWVDEEGVIHLSTRPRNSR